MLQAQGSSLPSALARQLSTSELLMTFDHHNAVVIWLLLRISRTTLIVGVELGIQILYSLLDVSALHILTRSVTPIHSLDFCGCFLGLWAVCFYV